MIAHSYESIARRWVNRAVEDMAGEVERIRTVMLSSEIPHTEQLIALSGKLIAAIARLEAARYGEMEPK